MPNQSIRIAGSLAVFSLAIYLLTASKTLQIGADEAVVYATAESLARHGGFEVDQVASLGKGEIWEYGQWGPDGHQYGKYGPVQPLLLAPFIWLAWQLPGIGPVDTSLLFNGMVTAVTVGLLFWVAEKQGFSQKTSILAALLYGFATFAWPYSKTLFGEPLSALLILASIAWALQLRITQQASDALLSSLFLGLAVGVKWSNGVVALPIFLFIILVAYRRRDFLLAWALPLSVVIGLLAWFNFARYGSPLETGYGLEPEFTTPILYGFWGLLFSPGKSLFLYSPILLLSLPGAWFFWKRYRLATFLILGSALAQILLYAAWWAWWGGWGWGPRLLVPTVPLLMLLALPVIEGILAHPRPLPMMLLIILATVSLGLQLLGISVHYSAYLGEQSQLDPQVNGPTITDTIQSPLVGQFRYLAAPYWDFAWIDDGNIDGLHLAAKLGFVGLATIGFWSARRGRERWQALLALGLGISIFGLARTGLRADEEYRILNDDLAKNPPDLLVLSDSAHQATFWNLVEAPIKVIGAPESPRVRPRLRALLDREMENFEISGGEIIQLAQTPPGDPESGVEKWLAGQLFLDDHRWYGDTRFLRFLMPPKDVVSVIDSPQVVFGDWAILEKFEIKQDSRALYVTLTWQATSATSVPYTVSLQLIDQQGDLISQHDGEPAASTRPTTGWQPGEEVIDRHALLLPGEKPTGQLLLIFYDPTGGGRAPVYGADGQPSEDAYLLLRFR